MGLTWIGIASGGKIKYEQKQGSKHWLDKTLTLGSMTCNADGCSCAVGPEREWGTCCSGHSRGTRMRHAVHQARCLVRQDAVKASMESTVSYDFSLDHRESCPREQYYKSMLDECYGVFGEYRIPTGCRVKPVWHNKDGGISDYEFEVISLKQAFPTLKEAKKELKNAKQSQEQWTCSRCAFLNHKALPYCEKCNTLATVHGTQCRPEPKKAPKANSPDYGLHPLGVEDNHSRSSAAKHKIPVGNPQRARRCKNCVSDDVYVSYDIVGGKAFFFNRTIRNAGQCCPKCDGSGTHDMYCNTFWKIEARKKQSVRNHEQWHKKVVNTKRQPWQYM